MATPTLHPTQSDSAQRLPASPMQIVAKCSESSQSTWRDALAAIASVAEALDSVSTSSAPLPSSALCRQASEVRAVCVNALVRICAGGAIPVKLDNQYFAINQAGELWKAIMLSRQIAVHSPGKIKEPRMELLIVLE